MDTVEKKAKKPGIRDIISKLKNMKIFKAMHLKSLLITMVVIIGIMVFPTINPQGVIIVGMDDTRIGIAYSEVSAIEIEFVDIKNVERVTYMELGEMISGDEDEQVRVGTFRNKVFDNYQLYQNISVGSNIVVITSDSTVVFNLNTLRKTEDCYEDIIERLQNQ